MSFFSKFVLAMCLWVSALTVAVAADKPPANPALLYHNYCSVCHGDRGDGRSRARDSLNPPPKDFSAPASRAELTRERIIAAITAGRPGTAMVGWSGQLSDHEIAALADYLLATFIQPPPIASHNRGQAIYNKNCAVCHGDKGDGGVWTRGLKFRPRNFTSPESRALSRVAMIDAVANGRPGTPMAAFGTQLPRDDIEAAVDYIRAAFMGQMPEITGLSGTSAHGLPSSVPQPTPSVARTSAVMPEHLHGDRQRGAEFYMGNCLTCHGAAGDGNGPRAYFIFPRPANFLSDAIRVRMDRVTLFNAIAKGKRGTEMPAWEKVLTSQQIADVTEFVYQAFIHPESDQPQKKK